MRQLLPSDDEGIFALRSDPAVNIYLDREPTKNREEAQAHITRINDGISGNKWLYWVLCLKDSPELKGTICLWNFSTNRKECELGYELLPLFQGNGIMDEAVKEIIRFGFEELKIDTLYANTHKLNERSSRLLLKNQFHPHPGLKDERNENLMVYFLKNDFFY